MSLPWFKKQVLTVAAVLAATVASAQLNFKLDTTFRTTLQQSYVNCLALLPAGDVLLSGSMRYPGESSNRLIALVNSDGERVTSFPYGYGGGKLTSWEDRFYVSVGQTVRRIYPTGIVDPSFIGLNTGRYFQSVLGGDYHVFPDGRILMTGSHLLRDSIRGFEGLYELIWFSNEGYLDTTRIHRRSNGVIKFFTELPNGQFICSGFGTTLEDLPVDMIFRIHPDGAPDTTFHSGVYWGEARSYLTLPDGRFYVCGRFQTTQLPGDTLHVARFLPNGTLDTTFSPPDFHDSGLNNPYGAYCWDLFALDPEHLLIGGTFISVDGQPRSGICMVDTTGQLLSAFNGQGVGPYQHGAGIYTTVQCIVPNADTSAIYISGCYNGYNDGTINDTQQRFVSRLLVEEANVSMNEHAHGPPENAPTMLVYPNPATGLITIEYPSHHSVNDIVLVFSDLQGRTLLRRQLNGSSARTHIDVGSLDPGAYLVQLQTSDGVVLSDRLIVQR